MTSSVAFHLHAKLIGRCNGGDAALLLLGMSVCQTSVALYYTVLKLQDNLESLDVQKRNTHPVFSKVGVF